MAKKDKEVIPTPARKVTDKIKVGGCEKQITGWGFRHDYKGDERVASIVYLTQDPGADVRPDRGTWVTEAQIDAP